MRRWLKPTNVRSPTEVTEAEIAVHWREEELYRPSPKFIAQANLADPAVVERFAPERFPECFREYADLLSWDRYWHTTLDTSDAPFWKWFVGGKLNASYNCVDRHLAQYKNKAAFIFVPEPEDAPHEVLTYQELYVRVNEVAALLRDFAGLKAGDRVTLHLPMTPELPITMLACARLGVIHSVVFGGFSGEACGLRAADSGSRVLITMDGYYRNGKLLDHKANADIAVAAAAKEGQKIDKVLVWRRLRDRSASETPMVAGRDHIMNDVLKAYAGRRVEPVSMDAEAPLFLMYTSGTTGRPKGCQHRTGGYLAYVAGTSKYIQDIHPTDVYWCFADIGWITGHSYIVYGPLALAATGVLYEGVPTYPDAGRPWRIAAAARRQHLPHLAHDDPDAAQGRPGRTQEVRVPLQVHDDGRRTDRAGGVALVLRHGRQGRGRDHRHVVADGERRLSDQHEAGARSDEARQRRSRGARHLPGDLRRNREGDPGGFEQGGQHLHPQPLAGDHADDLGRSRPVRPPVLREVQPRQGQQRLAGLAVLRGDGAMQAADGYYRILGRVDDVINVAGHRLGTKEIESACLTVPEVAEAAVVPVVDELRGRVPEVYVSLRPGIAPSREIEEKVVRAIETSISKIARPKAVHIVADMPKTRSGKIMRRDPRRDLEHDGHRRHHDAREPRYRRADPPVRAGRGAGRDQVGAGGHQAVRGRAVAAGSAAAARDSGAGRRGRPAPTVTSSCCRLRCSWPPASL